MAGYRREIGPLIYLFMAVFNLAAIGMYLLAERLRERARRGDPIRTLASEFLLLAPFCYGAGLALGLSMRFY
jgi:hypothetical protein